MSFAAPNTTGPATANQPSHTPSESLLSNFRQELTQHPPFAQMTGADVDYFLAHAQQQYFAPDETLLEPASGVMSQLLYIRQGAVTGIRGLAQHKGGAFEYQAGDLFPVSAALVGRAVSATYQASADTFVLALPVAAMHTLAQRSAVFADFLQQRTAQFLELSRKAVQAAYSAQAMQEQSLEKPLGELVRQPPIACTGDTALREALQRMHAQRIGSMLVTSSTGQPVGILTRYDILGRITLAQVPLNMPIAQVMVQPVHCLTVQDTAQDAALLMSRYGIRHVPITRDGVAVGMVSERDLFALQKQSLKSVSAAIRAAPDVAALQVAAADIRHLARSLLGQGVQARQLTALISHLNDALTRRLLDIKAAEHGVDLRRLCWLALGSEGRDEQTIATDQDNALILPNYTTTDTRAAIGAFAQAVNLALDACGYPLCKGGIMAGQPECCLTLDEWRTRFSHWIAQGSPADLLNASIYFDFRPLAGDEALAQTLRAEVVQLAQRTPRFHKQMALNALTRSVALNWRGAVDTDTRGTVDLKLQGTAVLVDAARLYSLAHGIACTNTRQRLEAIGPVLKLSEAEYGAWVSGFEFLQMLRLRIQLGEQASADDPNRIALASLNEIDQRILRESFRVARQLQQRLQLDYER
jgi:CBS domain-containing protein